MKNYFDHKMRGKSPATIVAMVLFGIIAISGLAILFGFVVMWLWNYLMPELFGLPTLTFWKAAALVILSKLLFGGFGGKGGSGKHENSDGDKCKTKKKSDFSKWAHYDKFWEEEGGKAYAAYCENIMNPKAEISENAKAVDTENSNDDTHQAE